MRLTVCFNVDLILKGKEHNRIIVSNDPVNWVDPLGLKGKAAGVADGRAASLESTGNGEMIGAIVGGGVLGGLGAYSKVPGAARYGTLIGEYVGGEVGGLFDGPGLNQSPGQLAMDQNTDGDGWNNYLDSDDDNDGIPDVSDPDPTIWNVPDDFGCEM